MILLKSKCQFLLDDYNWNAYHLNEDDDDDDDDDDNADNDDGYDGYEIMMMAILILCMILTLLYTPPSVLMLSLLVSDTSAGCLVLF